MRTFNLISTAIVVLAGVLEGGLSLWGHRWELTSWSLVAAYFASVTFHNEARQ